VSASGPYAFAGVEDNYFVAAFLNETSSAMETMTFSDTVPTPLNKEAQPLVGAAVGGEAGNRFALFVGPKDQDVLRTVNPRLEQLVDFGWFSFLAKPLFLAVHWTAERLVHNYGWAIVLVTIVINFILFPLKVSSMRSMKKMQALQPQIAAINDKYKGLSIRDPRKQQQNQEVMDLYKKYGVNPAGGCVPMLLQIPFFIAFYKVISVSIEMRGASWLWVTDLSQPEHLAIRILPITMIVSQFLMQKMTPTTSVDPNQQRMMMIMPLVFGFMFYGLSSGLVLYYLTSNLVGIAQQMFFNRTVTVADMPQPPAAKKRNGRK
jgi:YidC/Oxa1 family membrane protein insertase